MDPFAASPQDPQSLHKYLYCHANPANTRDASGLFGLCDIVITAGIIGAMIGLLLPAGSLGERLENMLMLGLSAALVADLIIVATAAVIVSLGLYFGVMIVSAETFITLSMIAVGGTTFAAGTQNSWYARQLSRLSQLRPWGNKTPEQQPVQIRLSREIPENKALEERLNNAYNKGQPRVTTLDRANTIKNRQEALKKAPLKEGLHRDEWPMAFTAEGGSAADVDYLAPHINQSTGATIGNKLRPYKDGTKFEVVFYDGPPESN